MDAALLTLIKRHESHFSTQSQPLLLTQRLSVKNKVRALFPYNCYAKKTFRDSLIPVPQKAALFYQP